MKKLTVFFTLLLLFAFTAQAMAATIVNKDGYYKGIKLCGKVKVVESFPDIKVKVVEAFPDHIGEWKFVEYGEDFKIQFVDAFEDIKIKFVTAFPGVE